MPTTARDRLFALLASVLLGVDVLLAIMALLAPDEVFTAVPPWLVAGVLGVALAVLLVWQQPNAVEWVVGINAITLVYIGAIRGLRLVFVEQPDRVLAVIAAVPLVIGAAVLMRHSVTGPGSRFAAVVAAAFAATGAGFGLLSGAGAYVVAAAAALTTGVAAFWLVPQWQANRWPPISDPKDHVELEDKARATVAQLLSGLGLLATLAITVFQVNQGRVAADRNLALTERSQASTRFSQAIDQLGAGTESDPALEQRIGAIYTLGEYARQASSGLTADDGAADSAVSVLEAYLRTNTPNLTGRASTVPASPEECAETNTAGAPAGLGSADITAVVDVLRDLAPRYFDGDDAGPVGPAPKLSRLDLAGADLSEMFLAQSDLRSSHLAGADFNDSDLTYADLRGADLRNACFEETDLTGARFEGADLRNACFEDANVSGARFEDANLEGVGFAEALNLPDDIGRIQAC